MTELPTVSVVVPVRDGLDDLRRCVEALLAQDYPAERVEIVVADNGSAESPAGVLPADPRVRLVHEPRGGSYAARNAALASAGGEIVAFTDADCRPYPDWLRQAVAALLAEPIAAMVGGAIELEYRYGRPVTGAEWYERLRGFPQEDYLRRGFAVTANLVTRRAVIDDAGPFDAALESGGDAEWGRRVRALGGIQRYAPEAVVRHPARATPGQLLRKSRRTTEGVAIKALRRRGGRRWIVRAIAGRVGEVLALTATVWFTDEPRGVLARSRYLGVVWANGLVVVAELARALVARPPGGQERRYST